MKLLDVVILREDISASGLKAGDRGVIVEVFDDPHQAYEVEFCDSAGRTIAQLALNPSQIVASDSNDPARAK